MCRSPRASIQAWRVPSRLHCFALLKAGFLVGSESFFKGVGSDIDANVFVAVVVTSADNIEMIAEIRETQSSES